MNASTRRAGFTLLELLVVMAIIAVLAGLTMSAVMKVRQMGPRWETEREINRLEQQLKLFVIEHKCYPPSQIRLCEKRSEYGNDQVDTRSLQILQKVFSDKMWDDGDIDWDGDGAYSKPVVLTGDQCLVFFLGGIPSQSGPGVRGFGAGLNPSKMPSRPQFPFKSNRLVKLHGNNFYSYRDPFGKSAYAYFSDNMMAYQSWPTLAPKALPCDCPDVPRGAYMSAPGTFFNPQSCQIISAGPDGVFGPGGSVVMPGTGSTLPVPAHDDISNFAKTPLGGI